MGSVTVPLDCRYLLHTPSQVGRGTILVVTLHGYGSDPETMLRLSVPAVGPECVVASLRGPHQYYHAGGPGGRGGPEEIRYNWGTRPHHDENIRLHHRMVEAALADLQARFEIPPARTVLMGFSQPVGLNYRFIGTYPDRAGAVLGLCGGVPNDWEQDKFRAVAAPILHISRSEDEYFPVETARGFLDRLRRHAADVEFHMLAGGHRFPSKARPIVKAWMTRIFADAVIF